MKKPTIWQRVKRWWRGDAFVNPHTGMGTPGKDRSLDTTFERGTVLRPETLSAQYHHNDLFRRVVTKLPTEALRQGFEVVVSQKEEGQQRPDVQAEISSKMNEALAKLGAVPMLLKADVWGRLFGGAALIVGVNDGTDDPTLPVKREAIKGVEWLRVEHRPELKIDSYYDDPNADKYGEPMIYAVHPTARAGGHFKPYKVHETRVILFGGALTTESERTRNEGFDFSVLQAPWDTLKANGTIWHMASLMLEENGIGILQTSGLDQIMSTTEGASGMTTRVQNFDLLRNFLKTALIHTSEKYTRIAVPLGGVKDVIEVFMQRVAAAVDMPATILWGRAPAGLNATGESDIRGWYDSVGAHQLNVIAPAAEALAEFLFLAKPGPTTDGKIPEMWEVKFPSLWLQTEQEIAAERKTVAETDAIHEGMGAVTADEIRINRFRPDGWSAETVIDTEASAKAIEVEKEEELAKLEEEPKDEPEPPLPVPPTPPVPPTNPDDEGLPQEGAGGGGTPPPPAPPSEGEPEPPEDA